MLTIHKAAQPLRPRYSHLLLMAMLGRIELLFDDLLDTNNWMLRERAREPLGLSFCSKLEALPSGIPSQMLPLRA